MSRTKGGFKTRRRRNRLLKQASGYWGARHKLYGVAKETVDRALAFAFGGRKQKKRDFRSLWIVRINAAVREQGLSYNAFVRGLKDAHVELDRRTLAEIAVSDPKTFSEVVNVAKAAS